MKRLYTYMKEVKCRRVRIGLHVSAHLQIVKKCYVIRTRIKVNGLKKAEYTFTGTRKLKIDFLVIKNFLKHDS